MHPLLAADPAPSSLQPIPASTTFIWVQKSSRQSVKPKVFCGDPAIFRSAHFDARPDVDSIYILDQGQVGWKNLIRQPTTGRSTSDVSLSVPVTTWQNIINPTAERCIAALVDSWSAERDSIQLYDHTKLIGFFAPVFLQQRYAAQLSTRAFKDHLKRTLAAFLISRVTPRLAFQLHFSALITPPEDPQLFNSPQRKIEAQRAKGAIEYFRGFIFDTLGPATDATNFETHWAWMQKAPVLTLKSMVLGQIIRDPFLREPNPLDPKVHLLPHRDELLALTRAPYTPLAYDAYIAICLADGTLQSKFLTRETFEANPAAALQSLAK
jgi:hypothetical protein